MKFVKISEKFSDFQYNLISLTFILSIISLYFRMGDLGYINRSLWAEDGNVFINQAAEFGYESIWMPYAGYLHLYPRIFGLLAGTIPLEFTAYVFFSGWLIAFFILVWVLFDRAIVSGVGKWASVAIILLISLQPANGEIYFSITNAQWFMGAALIIYLLIPDNISTDTVKSSILDYKEIPLIVLMGLTGPFSILVLPGLALRFYFFKDFHTYKVRYVTVFLCALVQLAVLVNSDRVSPGEIDHNIYHWLSAIKIFFTFGALSNTVVLLSIMFWVLLVYSLTRSFREKSSGNNHDEIQSVILIAIAFLTFFAGLYSMRASPDAIHPIYNGSRYYFIPYTLLFFSAVLISKEYKSVKIILICCIVVICQMSLHRIHRADLQYKAHVAFSEIKPDLIIPINPLWAIYPAWYVKPYSADSYTSDYNKQAIQHELLEISQIELVNASAYQQGESVVFDSDNNDPQLSLPAVSLCKSSQYVGVEVSIDRPESGWAQLFWSHGAAFSESLSIRRYFPEGSMSMYFAIDNNGNDLKLRLDPLETPGKVIINSMKVYCLK